MVCQNLLVLPMSEPCYMHRWAQHRQRTLFLTQHIDDRKLLNDLNGLPLSTLSQLRSVRPVRVPHSVPCCYW